MISLQKEKIVRIMILWIVFSSPFIDLGSAETFRVNSGNDVPDLTPGNGLCVAYLTIFPPFVMPYCTLRAAIEETNALPGPDVIKLGSGRYRISREGGDEDIANAGDFDITDSVHIVGAGSSKTFIDAVGLDRVLDIIASGITVTISDVSIVNGVLTDQEGKDRSGGAGIRNQGVLILENSIVEFNTHIGISDYNRGGGILNQGMCRIVSSTIRNNSAQEGGGIYNNQDGTLYINSSTLNANNAIASGGGISNHGFTDMTNSTISGNEIISETIYAGGGIKNNGDFQLSQCTIAANLSSSGGGISNSGTFSVINTLMAGNQGGNCLGESDVLSGGHNLDSNGTCQMSAMNSDLQDIDPHLIPLRDNGGPTQTHAISFSSPARDGGKTLVSITHDQRGYQHIAGNKYDIGSFEASVPVNVFITPLLLNKKVTM